MEREDNSSNFSLDSAGGADAADSAGGNDSLSRDEVHSNTIISETSPTSGRQGSSGPHSPSARRSPRIQDASPSQHAPHSQYRQHLSNGTGSSSSGMGIAFAGRPGGRRFGVGNRGTLGNAKQGLHPSPAGASPLPLSAYEKRRLENMERNKVALLLLCLPCINPPLFVSPPQGYDGVSRA
jgi:hypothetical protein